MKTQLWGTATVVLRRKLIVMCIHVKNSERSQINNPVIHNEFLRKQDKTPKLVGRNK
jgi:hypothetical protein